MWRLGLLARTSAREFHAMYPWRVLATTVLPRVGFQVTFFTLIGAMAAGPTGAAFVFVGALAHVTTLATIVFAPLRFMEEKWQGTAWRLRLGILPVALVYMVRSWPFAAEALAYVTVMTLVLAPTLGFQHLVPDLLTGLPYYAAVVFSTLAFGLAVTMVSGRRGDIFAANTVVALLLVSSGAVFDPAGMPIIDQVGHVLPIRHGLEAVRLHLAGASAAVPAALEVAVGLGWLAVGSTLSALQGWRARRIGADQYA